MAYQVGLRQGSQITVIDVDGTSYNVDKDTGILTVSKGNTKMATFSEWVSVVKTGG